MYIFIAIVTVLIAYILGNMQKRLNNLCDSIKNNINIAKYENDYLEVLMNIQYSCDKMIRNIFSDRHEAVIMAIRSTLQSMNEKQDFTLKQYTELNNSAIDIISGILSYNKIDMNQEELSYIKIIVSSYIKIFMLNPALASKVIVAA